MLKSAIGALGLAMGIMAVTGAWGMPPLDKAKPGPLPLTDQDRQAVSAFRKGINQPNFIDYSRIRWRLKLMELGRRQRQAGLPLSASLQAGLQDTTLTGSDRVLVILVEFAGTNTFTWTPGVSTWDPFGRCDSTEYTGSVGTTNATTNIIAKFYVTGPTNVTYSGPLHNQIPQPLSAADRSGDMIWTPDFAPGFYSDLIFGNGVIFDYARADGSLVHEDFTGKSVNKYYNDASSDRYSITGEVIGWLKLTNSTWWYGADPAPGARSVPSGVACPHNGGIPGAGNSRALVVDALNAVKAAYPSFNWTQYDQNGDGVIDRLWIIHAGLGEEDSTTTLNRTPYGEAAMWSHSATLLPMADIVPGIKAGPYIMMPENCGIGVLAHESGHNLGADDLYAYGDGDASAGFWTLMADDWTGYPIGFLPPAIDPWHLDNWGWLDPKIISDPGQVYEVMLGQASYFPGGANVYRGVKIELPDQKQPFPVQPIGTYQWWGGEEDLANAMMTMTGSVALLPAGGTLTFKTAYEMESGWDFLWVQVSTNGGISWNTLTNNHTTTNHDGSWIGSLNGFPDDLNAAGIGGFSGTSAGWPSYQTETFSLNSFAGQNLKLRFWYMTDWGTLESGPFIDDIRIASGATILFADNADAGDANWTYALPWERNSGARTYTHNFYLQWRNVSASGGYDSALADARWRFGPANSGLLVWYNNNQYTDNEVANYLTAGPGFGPKGRMLVVDANPEPYRDPYYVTNGYSNEGANVSSRSLMRDAPFSLNPSVGFSLSSDWCYSNTVFAGRPAVSAFSDSLGYYPGAEFIHPGPGYPPSFWVWLTKQWDASVVMPATNFYGVWAPGYTNEPFYAGGYRSDGGLLSVNFAYGHLGYNGGTGNPSEPNGQYGWNALIVTQSLSQAAVVIWNSRAELAVTAVDDAYTAYRGHMLTVTNQGVVTNDLGPVGATRLAELVSDCTHGTLALNEDGSFTYTPDAGFLGADSFTYRCKTYYGAVSSNSAMVTLNVTAVEGDFDGDGLADPYWAVKSNVKGMWTIWMSSGGYLPSGPYELSVPGGEPVPVADFDGDGLVDPVMVADGGWIVWFSSGGYLPSGPYIMSVPGGEPVAGDFDGDRKADPAMVANGGWTIWFSTGDYLPSGPYIMSVPGGEPVAGDFDGDRKADPAMVADGGWTFWFSSGGYLPSGPYVLSVPGTNVTPMCGDFDGDGYADPVMVINNNWTCWFSSSSYLPSGPYLFNP